MAISLPTADDIREIFRTELRTAFNALDGRVEPYLDSKGAAAFLATTEQSVRWLVANRDLPHRRAQGARKGRLLFRASELERWVEERKQPQQKEGHEALLAEERTVTV